MPGPLFNISAYLGAVAAIRAGISAFWGVAACWLGLFGPGVMLIYGVLPFWGLFRSHQLYRRALPGLNASAVGLIVAAAVAMTLQLRTFSPFPNASVATVMLAYVAADLLNVQVSRARQRLLSHRPFNNRRGFWFCLAAQLTTLLLPPATSQAPLVVVAGAAVGVLAWAVGAN